MSYPIFPWGRVPFGNDRTPVFSLRIGLLALATVIVAAAFPTNTHAQLTVTTNPTGAQVVDSGSELCVDINYAWASTTTNLNDVELKVVIPAEFGGATPADFDALTINPHIDSVTFDTNTRELLFDFVDPLDAGASGFLKFCVSHSNGSTEDGTTSVLDINFSAPGETPSATSVSVEANASSKIDISKATIGNIQPAQGEATPYQVIVNNNQGPGNYDAENVVVTDTLPPGATLVSASPPADSTVVDDQGNADPTDDVTTLTWNFGSIPAGSAKGINMQVRYDDPLGTLVTNVADFTGQDPFGSPVSGSVSDPRTVSAPDPSAGFTKTASTTKVSLSDATDDVTETISYSFDIANSGNVLLNDYVIEDTFPAGFVPTRLWTGYDTALSQQNNVKVEYQLDSDPGVWVEHADSPFLSPFDTDPLNIGNNEVDLTVLGGTVIAVRWTFDTLPIAYNNGGGTAIFGEYRAPAVVGSTVTNDAKSSDPTDTSQVTVGSTVDVEIVGASPRPVAGKRITSSSSGGPTDTISYRITITNSYGASTTLDSPVATDILPPNVTFVPGSVVASPSLTNFTEGVDGGTGRPLLTFDWTGQSIAAPVVNPSPGSGSSGDVTLSSFTVDFDVTVDPGTAPQSLVNDAQLTYTNPLINDSSGSANTTPPSTFTVIETGLLDARKWVVGDLDLPSTDPDDLNFADGDDDQAYETRFPDTGGIVPGGQFRYRVSMFNPGNEPLNNVKVMEILPWVGDIGVVATGDSRDSEWQANLIQHASQSSVFPDAIVYDINGTPSSQSITVNWSTSTNPTRSDLDINLGDPTGGDAGSFNAGALPADLTTVRSLLFEFPGLTLGPLESAEFYFYLTAPEAAPSDAVAWNSIGRAADVVATGNPILPAEPLKVGVKLDSVSLGNLVWIDSSAGSPATTDNGLYDSGVENPLEGAQVELFQYVDGILQRAQSAYAITSSLADEVTPAGSPLLTDATGLYEFAGLMPSGTTYDGVLYGDFVVQVTPPAGLEDQYVAGSTGAAGYEPDPNGDTDNNNNGIDTGSGNVLRSGDITLTLDGEPTGDGQTSGDDADGNLTIDFAYVANEAGTLLADVGNAVWLDANADGVKDAGEAAIEGATVELFDAATGLPVLDAHGNPAVPRDAAGNPLTDGKTGSDGIYEFIDLLPGDYVVKITPPVPPANTDPYQLTPVNGTLDDQNHGVTAGADLGNIAAGDIVSPTVTLNAGDTDNTVDFGLIRPLSLGDLVWIDGSAGDANAGNGTQDSVGSPGEAPLAGVTVELFNADGTPATHIDGSAVQAETTDANGNYLFENLLPGDYIVRVAPQTNYELTVSGGDPDNDSNTDSNAGLLGASLGSLSAGDIVSDPVTLDIGLEPTTDGDANPDSNRSVDFGFIPVPAEVVSLGNRVWYDQNANGIQDSGELNIDGATVELFNADGTPAIDAYLDPVGAVTTSGGAYSFGDLLPGDYIVKVTPPAGSDFFVTPVASADTGDAASDADNNGATLGAALGDIPAGSTVSPVVSLGAGEDDPKIDFGLTQTVSVGNYVWVDSSDSGATQGDGIQDAGENPFPGAEVWLLVDLGGGSYAQATDNDGNLVPADTTDANGLYEFSNLRPGNYVVAVEEPQYYDLTPVNNPDPNDETGTYLTDNNGVTLIALDIDGNPGDETLIISGPVTLYAGTEPLLDDGSGAAFGTPSDPNGNGAVDFGLVPEPTVVGVSVGDFVWLDENRNGIVDGAEAGIAGATVELLDAAGNPVLDADLNPVAAQVTDSSGAYNFTNLIPGDYKIRVTPPADHAVVKVGGLDPDADATNNDNNAVQVAGQTYGETPLITLGAGDNDPAVDIGLVELVSLGDYVWFDLNADGGQTGESGIENASVELLMESSPGSGTFVAAADAYGNTITAQSTGTDGLYAFGDLYPGDYKVRVTPPAGMILTPHGGGDPDDVLSDTDNNGVYVTGEAYVESAPVSLEANDEPTGDGGTPDDNNGDYTVDFGFIEPVSLGDIVWWDRDGDGTQDGAATEPGIAGITVTLFEADGTTPATDYLGNLVPADTTDANGVYGFGNLLPGSYVVRVETPADHVLTAGVGADAQTDNDGNAVAGQTYVQSDPVTLTVRGETDDGDADANNDPTVDFGFVQTVSVGNYVWLDVNGDGQQTGEPLLANVNVALFEADGTTQAKDYKGDNVAPVLTDASGKYEFADLLEGDYIVRVTPPANHYITPASVDPDLDDSNTDNNGYLNGANVESLPVTLTVDDEPTGDEGGSPDDDNGDLTVDFGFVQTVAVGSIVFQDPGYDGDLTGDDPLQGATVELFQSDGVTAVTDVNGNTVGSQTTGPAGTYEFNDLYPGSYVVRVTPPAGWAPTPVNEGDPNGNDSDTDSNGQPVSGEAYAQSAVVVLTIDGEPSGDGISSNSKDENGNGTIDFGFVQTVSIGNLVWVDSDVDGDLTGEAPLEGATVSLWASDGAGGLEQATDASGALVADIVTGSDGLYEFTNLYVGDYVVRVAPPAGYLRTPNGGADPDADASNTDNNGLDVAGQSYVQSEFVTLSVGGEPLADGTSANPVDANGNLTVDFGFYQPVSLGDYVWFDADGDGTQGGGESGIAGATVTLIDNATGVRAKDKDGVDVADFTTLADGLYSFGDLLPGDYVVRVTPPNDYVLTGGTGADPQTDNNGAEVAGQAYVESGVVTLASGAETGDGDANASNDPTVDFGFTETVSLGDFVWLDSNVNGQQDDGPTSGVSGALVELFLADGTTPATDYTGAAVPSQTTGADGLYEFTDLLPGDYVVRVTPPAEHVLTPFGGADPDGDPSNSDNNGVGVAAQSYVQSAAVSLAVDDEPTTDGGGSPDDDNGNLSVDFGFVPGVSLGDTVWLDDGGTGSGTPNDGIQNGDEAGIQFVTVQLFPASVTDLTDPAQMIAEVETDSSGNYQFNDLLPGDYIVYIPASEFAPGETLELLASSNGNGAYAPDPDLPDTQADDNGTPDAATGGVVSLAVTLSIGGETADDAFDSDPNNNSMVDFGFTPKVSLGDTVWADTDNSGVLDGGELGIADVVVQLFPAGATPGTDAPLAETATGPAGDYLFDNLAPGDYFVHIPASEFGGGEPLEGLASSNAGGTAPIAPDPDDDTQSDDNGTPDLAGGGVSTLPVTLTVGGETADDAVDFDSDNNSTVDLGFTEAVSLGDYVWLDADNSGSVDGGELPIADVVIQLFPAGADLTDPAQKLAETATDASGLYQFDNLAPGDYIVYIPASEFGGGEPLEGLANSNGNGSVAPDPDDNVNDDDNGTPENNGGVVSAAVTLTVGGETGDGDADADNNDSVDFGFTPQVSLGDTVWLDMGGTGSGTINDGTQDGDEPGIAGVTVELYPAGADPNSTQALLIDTTDGSGNYLFDALAPGDYFVFIPDQPALTGLVSSTGNGQATDPDDDVNSDDDGEPVTGGYQSAVVTLAVGAEPTNDGDASADSNLSVDFGFTDPTDLVSLGDTVWEDTDNSGALDGGEAGIPGVAVELYQATQTPGVDTPYFTTTTDSNGNYRFENLNPGDYVVFLPPSNFATGEPLVGMISSTGNEPTPDPDGDVDNNDNGDPSGGGIVAAPVTLATGAEPAGNDNPTVDFGIYDPFEDSWGAFIAAANGSGGDATDPDSNPDGDIYSDLLEYAFGAPAASGNNAAAGAGGGGELRFCAELGATSGTVDAFYTRPIGLPDVTYTLQTATAPGSPTSWTPWSGPAPTVVDNGDGTETVTFADLETTVGTQGIARLQVDLDDGVTQSTSYTGTFGWHTQTNSAACETFSFPYAPKSVFSGTPGAVSADNLTLAVVGTPSLEAGAEYYIEILSGTYAGHRFDVASVAADTVVLDGASTRNTLDPVPDLTGAPFALRPHATLDSIAPPELFASNADPLLGDRILTYDGGVWTTYFVYENAGLGINKQWTRADDFGLADAGATVVDACQAFFLHPKSGDVDVTMTGVVREWPFACPLDAGYNLVGSGYPLDQSADGRAMERIDGDGNQDWFTGSNDPLQADQLMFWLGDGAAGADGYRTYFRLDLGVPAYDYWTDQTNSNLADADADLLFKLGRGAFYDMMQAHDRSDPAAVWLWPAPWAP